MVQETDTVIHTVIIIMQVACLTSSYDKFRKVYPEIGYFLVQVLADNILVHSLKDFDAIRSEGKVSTLVLWSAVMHNPQRMTSNGTLKLG